VDKLEGLKTFVESNGLGNIDISSRESITEGLAAILKRLKDTIETNQTS